MLAVVIACSPAAPPPPSASTTDLIVGFPEGNLEGGEDLGIRQLERMLTQEGLLSGSPDSRPGPRLAERYGWENDGHRLRLHLRPSVFFHDGTELTAPVVVEILKREFARRTNQANYSSLADIVAIRDEGKLEVVIELSQKSAFLPEDLDLPLPLGPGIGAGPYQVVKQDSPGIVLERFDRYWQGQPAIERIQVKPFAALRTAWSSLLRDEVDMVTDVPAEAVEFVSNDQVEVLHYRRRYQYMVAFNSRHTPLSHPAVRRALNLAVDRPMLIQRALRGYGSPATGPLWPRHWAYNASIAPFAFNQSQATALLDAAGFRKGLAGQRSNFPGARLKFTCLLVEGFSLHERLGLELQKQLYDIGVDMQFETVSVDEFNERVPSGQFEAVLIDMISGPSFGRPYLFWRSAKTFDGLNKFGWENAGAEAQFAVLRASALDETATRVAAEKLQRIFLEDPPALFLAWSERARVVGPRFTPVIEDDRDPVLTMWRWKPADDRQATAR